MGTPLEIGSGYDVGNVYVYYNRDDKSCQAFIERDRDADRLVSAAESGGIEAHKRMVSLAQRTSCAGLVFAGDLPEARGLAREIEAPLLAQRKSDRMKEAVTPYALGLLVASGLATLVAGVFYKPLSEHALRRTLSVLLGTVEIGLGFYTLVLDVAS